MTNCCCCCCCAAAAAASYVVVTAAGVLQRLAEHILLLPGHHKQASGCPFDVMELCGNKLLLKLPLCPFEVYEVSRAVWHPVGVQCISNLPAILTFAMLLQESSLVRSGCGTHTARMEGLGSCVC